MNKQEDTSDLTGLSPRIPKTMKLNEVRFNGKDGKFVYVDVLGRKEGEKPETTDLGSGVSFIFLRQRRRIAGFNKSIDTWYVSTEHNDKNDNVYLFGARAKGRAEDLYEKYKDVMHTERIVYGFLLRPQHDRELVRIIVKGSTLNWKREQKAPTTVDYFAYIQDEKRVGHIYEYVSNMTSVKEKNSLGEYYSINFTSGTKLTDKQVEIVVEKLEEIRDYVKEQDDYYKTAQKPLEADVPVIDAEDDKVNMDSMTPAYDAERYPKEEINPSDIPF